MGSRRTSEMCIRDSYFGIPYPGDKLDLVAVPEFLAGAMENFGCVTFREDALLCDPACLLYTSRCV